MEITMFEKMYGNIGNKIKIVGATSFLLESIAAVITGISLMATDDELVPIGILVMLGGPISAYIVSLFIVAFGELVAKTCDIERNTRNAMSQNKVKEEKRANNKKAESTKTSNKKKNATEKKSEKSLFADHFAEKFSASNYTTFTQTNARAIICDNCKFEQPNSRDICIHCGKRFISADEVISVGDKGDEYALLVEKEESWGQVLVQVLEDNNIPCIALPFYGEDIDIITGTQNKLKVYIPSEKLPHAMALVDELFSTDSILDEE